MGCLVYQKTFLFLSLFLLVSFASQSIARPVVGENQGLYGFIGDQYLRSLPPVPVKEALGYEPQPINLEKVTLTDQEKLSILVPLLAQEAEQPAPNQLTLDMLIDLQTFYGNPNHPDIHLHSLLDETNTVFGKAGLVNMLAQPLTDVALLQARQNFIKELVENEQLFNKIQDMLSKVHSAESSFFGYWQKENPQLTKLINAGYFGSCLIPGKSTLNKSAVALEVGTRLSNAWTGFKIASPFVYITALKTLGNYIVNFNKEDCGLITKLDVPSACKSAGNDIKNLVDPRSLYNGYKHIQSGEEYKKYCAIYEQQNIPVPLSQSGFRKLGYALLGTTGFIKVVAVGGWAYLIKSSLGQAADRKNIINYVQEQLIDVATIVNATKQMARLARSDKVMNNGLFLINDAYSLFDETNQSADFAELVSLLQTDTFKGSASFFSLSGRVMAAHNLMKKTKDNFAASLQALGELDACLAIAKVYKKFASKKVGYSFAQYKTGVMPHLELNEFWNPFVKSDTVVTNSLTLDGNNGARSVILTGSNMGGKSTLLKGVMINCLFAQTVTIVPAQQMIMTPFILGTSLNISDDTVAGDSLFKSEVNRAKSIVDTVDNTPANKFVFLGIDELFTGTAADKGGQAACNVAQHLASKSHCLFIFATHFPVVTSLEEKTNGACENMKMEVYKKEDGTFDCPYKMERGVSTQNIANDILAKEITGISF